MLNTDQNDGALQALRRAFEGDPTSFCRVQEELLTQYRIAETSKTAQSREMTLATEAIKSARRRMGEIPTALSQKQGVFRSETENKQLYRVFFSIWEHIEGDVTRMREGCSRLIALSLSVQDAYRYTDVCASSCRAVLESAGLMQDTTLADRLRALVAQAMAECERLERIEKRLRDQFLQLRDLDTRLLHRIFEEVWRLTDVPDEGASFDRTAILRLLDSADKEIGAAVEQIETI